MSDSKIVLIVTLFMSYLLLVANRKSFQYVIPYVSKEDWISKTDIGFIVSSQTFGYTISKFLGGLAADHVDNRLMLVISVLLASIITQAFAFSQTVALSALLWFISGCIQGVTWPAIAQILRTMVPPDNFGTCWVIISCAMNIASMVAPVISAYISEIHRWTLSLTCIASVTFVYFFILCAILLRQTKSGENRQNKKKRQDVETSWLEIFTNPIQMSLCAGYFGISVLRFTATDWMPLYLTKDVGMSQMFGSTFISILETGGIFGSLIAAQISDRCIKSYGENYKNPRFPCIIVFTMIAVNATFLIASQADATRIGLVSVLAFVLGFSIYGPVALYGMIAIESAPDHITSSCHTMVALYANIGSTVAGYPIGKLSNYIGWTHTFYVIIIILGMSAIFLYSVRKSDSLKTKAKVE